MNDQAPSPRLRWRELAVALLAAYLFRLGAALLLSLAPASAVAASGMRNLVAGDAALFARGGAYLIEVLIDQREQLAELLFPSLVLLLMLAFAAILPEWAALRAFGAPSTPSTPSPPASRALPRLGAIGVLTWGLRALLVFTTSALALTLRSYFVGASDERWPTFAMGVMVLIGLALQGIVSVWHDLTEIHIVAHDAPPRDAVADAFTALRERGPFFAVRYLAALLASGAVVIAAFGATSLIDVSQGGSGRALFTAAVHQAAVLATIGIRMGWLWSAWRRLGRREVDASARPPEPISPPPVNSVSEEG
jgi:hypothetical protein